MNSGTTEQLTFNSAKISGDGDADRLETQLSGVEGVRDVEVNTDDHSVAVSYDPTIVNAARLQALVESAGYPLDAGDQ
jgi:copper chaperone CopZ